MQTNTPTHHRENTVQDSARRWVDAERDRITATRLGNTARQVKDESMTEMLEHGMQPGDVVTVSANTRYVMKVMEKTSTPYKKILDGLTPHLTFEQACTLDKLKNELLTSKEYFSLEREAESL